MSNSKKMSQIQQKFGGGKELTKISNKMDKLIYKLVSDLKSKLEKEFKVNILHEKDIKLKYVVEKLRKNFPKENWNYKFDKSSMRPDGGILFIIDREKNKYPILIAEQKKQGTNDEIIATKGRKQASGNAIERMGKNVIGFRTWLKNESIFPYVCFGYGWDFNEKSSIIDRIITIAEFGKLNETNLYNTEFTKRGSFYFKEHPLNKNEIFNIMYDIAKRSIQYYFSKYSDKIFVIKYIGSD